MAVRIDKVDLPGIGTRHDLLTTGGRRIGVVSQRNGDRQLVFFDAGDPDAASDSVNLSDDETDALVDILGLVDLPEALPRSPRHARHSLQLIDQ